MNTQRYIQVLLPLKLEWEPVYALPEGSNASIGDKIEVNFAGKNYVGIVTETDVIPQENFDIKEAGSVIPGLTRNLKLLDFWRQLASYYLCTPGEVYKASFIKEKMKEKPTVFTPLSPSQEAIIAEIESVFSKGKTVVLEGPERDTVYLSLAQETLASGKSVLHLVPTRKKRMIMELASNGDAHYYMGTRNALFLPLDNLGLVIVDEEQDTSYKQDSPAPRFNTREAAIMLANIHGASVLLGSSTPSIESLYNAERGLFTKVELKQNLPNKATIINISDEVHKNGMSGSFSFKLLDEIKSHLNADKKVLFVCRTKASESDCKDEFNTLFPEITNEQIATTTPLSLKTIDPEDFGLIAFLDADCLLGKEDFRSDEHALQLLQQLASKAPVAIQTREHKHPVFKALTNNDNCLTFLEERRIGNYPPFTRLVDIVIRDKSQKRIDFLSKLLAKTLSPCIGPYTPSFDGEVERVRIIRITLERNKSLKSRKTAIYQAVKAFEKDHKYTGHIVIDVDPV